MDRRSLFPVLATARWSLRCLAELPRVELVEPRKAEPDVVKNVAPLEFQWQTLAAACG